MIRDLIPGADCDNVGGLPSVVCDPTPAVAYEVPLTGQWNPGAVGEFAPVLGIGTQVADLTPEPPGPIESELAFSLVTGVPPETPAEAVPAGDAWQVFSTDPDTVSLGFVLPLPIVSGFIALHVPLWFRIRTTDALGCTTTAYVYFPDGLPETATDDVPVVLLAGGEVYEITVEAAPADDEAGPVAEQTIEVTPECPPARRAVAVAPACEFPVQVDAPVEIDAPEGGVPVSIEGVSLGEGETVPVSVVVPEGESLPVLPGVPVQLTPASVPELEGTSGGGLQTQAIPDGWLKLIIYGAGDTSGVVQLGLPGGGALAASNNGDGAYGPLVVDAPVGYSLGDCTLQVESTGGASVYGNAVAFYPPA